MKQYGHTQNKGRKRKKERNANKDGGRGREEHVAKIIESLMKKTKGT